MTAENPTFDRIARVARTVFHAALVLTLLGASLALATPSRSAAPKAAVSSLSRGAR